MVRSLPGHAGAFSRRGTGRNPFRIERGGVRAPECVREGSNTGSDMPSGMDPFTELAVIVGISVAAHVTIAWSAIAYHARRAERKWMRLVNEEMIPHAAREASETILPMIEARIPGLVSAAIQMPDFSVIGADAAARVVSALESKFTGEAGAAARAGQSAAEKMLAGSISFGNPMLDGLWAFVPPDMKKKMIGTLYKTVRMGGANGEAPEPQRYLPSGYQQ